jgi:hypothetical protein
MFHVYSLPVRPAVIRALWVFLLFAGRLPVAAQAPVWQSARAVAGAAVITGNLTSVVTAAAVDAAGNVYLAGYFTNTVAVGSTTLASAGDYDVFVAKFSPATNQFVWAQRAGGSGADYATALAVRGANVFVAGHFESPAAGFGATTLANAGVAGTSDAFAAKLTDAGGTASFAWAQRAGGAENDYADALAASGGSVYVAGGFESPLASFGPVTLANADAGAGSRDAFVAKLTDAGPASSFAWAQRAGGRGHDRATALAVSGAGVYVAGYFANTAGFGPVALTSAGLSDAFVAKLADAGPTGAFVWAARAGGPSYDEAAALDVSGPNVYAAGAFQSAGADFGPAMLTNAGAGSTDAFVAKLTDAGSTGGFVWAQRAGGTLFEGATSLAVIGANVFVAGHFESPAAGFGATTLANGGYYDAFVAKLADAGPTGAFAWADRAGGAYNDYAAALATSGASVYAAGYFQSPAASFGPVVLPNPNGTSPLGFLATLTDRTLTATAAGRAAAPAQISPNPARRTSTLHGLSGGVAAPLTLTDALGRAVRHYPAPAGGEAVLDLQGVPAGLYLLRGAGAPLRLVVE